MFSSQKVHMSVKEDAYFIKIIIRCFFSVKKLKLESLKFSFFRAVERQDI